MRWSICSLLSLSLMTSCVIPRAVDRLGDVCPPPEFGRPAWVRTSAGIGGWIGGVFGGVVSIGLLPVTYPISILAKDGLGETAAEEWMFFPALGGAALGHFLFGAPPDAIDYVVRRAWLDEQLPENSYELVPMQPPRVPVADR
jgi:hypothetical protein